MFRITEIVFLIARMPARSIFFTYRLHHLLFWAAAFGVWYYLRYQDYRTTNIALQVTLLKVVDLAAMIYVTNYLLIPRLLYKKQYALFVSLFVLLVLTSSISKMYFIGQITDRADLF